MKFLLIIAVLFSASVWAEDTWENIQYPDYSNSFGQKMLEDNARYDEMQFQRRQMEFETQRKMDDMRYQIEQRMRQEREGFFR